MSTCSVNECMSSRQAHGYCSAHYHRWKRYGDPLGKPQRPTIEDRFTAKVEWRGECLVWVASKVYGGYGAISIGGETIRAHRYAWERENGPIPKGMSIDHICHNPPCVNIEHLRLATNAENNANQSGANSGNKSSGIRNVYPNGSGWQVRIGSNGESHYFGTYGSVEEAAKVAERKRKELFGEFAGKG